MKKIIILIVLSCFFTCSVYADHKKMTVGGWGTSSVKFSSMGGKNPFSENSDFAMLLALRGGFILNNFNLGLGFNTLVNNGPYDCKKTGVSYGDYDDSDSDGWGPEGTEVCNDCKNPKLNFYYFGVFAGYTFLSDKVVKIEVNDFIGFGNLHAGNYSLNYDGETYSQDFFIMEPEVSFLFTFLKFFAVSINISYRIPAMLNTNECNYYSAWEISGPAVGLDLRLGYFNYKNSP